jgi:hypothetical protein
MNIWHHFVFHPWTRICTIFWMNMDGWKLLYDLHTGHSPYIRWLPTNFMKLCVCLLIGFVSEAIRTFCTWIVIHIPCPTIHPISFSTLLLMTVIHEYTFYKNFSFSHFLPSRMYPWHFQNPSLSHFFHLWQSSYLSTALP